jgi:hypothetical protein
MAASFGERIAAIRMMSIRWIAIWDTRVMLRGQVNIQKSRRSSR